MLTLLSGVSGPVVLQQILRAMENPRSPRHDAATFAALSLLLRLIVTQSTVFNLWFSRRCYERSRGEMITMIFEKTLGRKIIASPKKPYEAEDAIVMNGSSSLKAEKSAFHPRILIVKVWDKSKSIFRSDRATKVTEPASMGKILNLMRYVRFSPRI